MAQRAGELIARRGAALVCGGLGGVMEAASRGASMTGGVVIGVLPGDDARACNPHVTYPVATGMGHARNVIIVRTAHVLIAFEGESGTLSEIAIALKLGKPVIGVDAWRTVKGVIVRSTPEEAVEEAFGRIGRP